MTYSGATIKLKDLIPHPENPRSITKEGLENLKEKLKLPDGLCANRIAYDDENLIWSGNQRVHGLIELGYEVIPEEWTFRMEGWSLEDKKKFMLISNINDGEWARDKFESEYWQDVDLSFFGDNTLKYIQESRNYEDDEQFWQQPTEGDSGSSPSTKKIVLEYSEDEYNAVTTALSKIAKTPEQAVYKLLEL